MGKGEKVIIRDKLKLMEQYLQLLEQYDSVPLEDYLIYFEVCIIYYLKIY